MRRLYLSPHLDDAALSCGGAISRAARAGRAGEAVEIFTVFAGDEPAEPATPLVSRLYELWALAPGTVMAARRTEDFAAARRLGAAATHDVELEAVHRRDPESGEPLYPDLAALYGPVAEAEAPLVAALATRLASLPPADFVAAPLGVGGHVDHRLLRAAAERAFGDRLALYEEFPYVLWKPFAVRRARGPASGWEALVEPLDADDVRARIEAIGCYASQVQPLFGSGDRLEKMVRRHVRRAGGERLWRRRAREGNGR